MRRAQLPPMQWTRRVRMPRTRSTPPGRRCAICAAAWNRRSKQLATRVQQAVQRGLEAASAAVRKAQRQIEQAAEVTGKYIADQPMRSVLVAAAAGAAITALIVLASRRRDDY